VAELFPPVVYYIALVCFILGNAAVIYMNFMTTRFMNQGGLLRAAATVPLYWCMMSAAAAKAVFQLVCTPFYWEKTSHGLSGSDVDAVASSESASAA
jgi:glycosyltransferase XagB